MLVAATAVLSSCGSDGPRGSGALTPTPASPSMVNAAPIFTSPAALSVPENASGVVYTAGATDANGDQLTFSISAGVDASRFQITPEGALSFRASPDFETPTDGNVDNVYEVELFVVDNNPTGALAARLTVNITVTNDTTGGTGRLRLVASGFTEALGLTPATGSQVFVAERRGRVVLLNAVTGAVAATPFLDVSAEVSTVGRRGLLGFAPAPDFAISGRVYAALINAGGELEVRRYRTFAANSARADPASADLIMKIPAAPEQYAAGWIGFGPDGLLWVTTGAGATANTDGQSLLGKLLRIDVSRDEFPADPDRDYAIPSGNAGGIARPEIFASGFKAPRSASIDPATGTLLVSDFGRFYNFDRNGVPQHGDEVNLVRPSDAGTDYSPENTIGAIGCGGGAGQPPSYRAVYCAEDRFAAPTVADFYNVVVGPVYRGQIEFFRARGFLGQEVQGGISTLQEVEKIDQNRAISARSENLSTAGVVTGFGYDASRNVYFLRKNGEIYALEPV